MVSRHEIRTLTNTKVTRDRRFGLHRFLNLPAVYDLCSLFILAFSTRERLK